MKKIFTFILTMAFVISLATVPAFAATSIIDSATGSDSHNVTATYNAGASGTTIYSVTITWGEMDFAYNDGAWNPDTHTYDASWTATGNTVTVNIQKSIAKNQCHLNKIKQ